MPQREGRAGPPGPNGMQDLDELQRGEERPISIETMERTAPYRYGDNGPRQIPVPEPGERPGAISVDTPQDPASA